MKLADRLAIAASLIVFGLYGSNAASLIRYPWDWGPDEGLHLDYARRLLRAPQTLYAFESVPVPAAYAPLLPAVLAPVVWLSSAPLGSARLVALGWTTLMAATVYALTRRKAPVSLALAATALALAPVTLSSF